MNISKYNSTLKALYFMLLKPEPLTEPIITEPIITEPIITEPIEPIEPIINPKKKCNFGFNNT